MVSDAQQYTDNHRPQPPRWPVVVVICLGFNLFEDTLRDALDPTTSSRD